MYAKKSSQSVGRNDPCPCGSGRKYKKCCLKAGREEEREAIERWDAFKIAFRWLYERYPEEVDEAIDARLAALVPRAVMNLVDSMSPELVDFLELQEVDWLVAEGRLEIDGASVEAQGLFLDQAGDRLSPDQRRWLEAAATSKTELFEVVGATQDLLRIQPVRSTAANDAIHEIPRVSFLDNGVLEELRYFGARLVPWKGGYRPTFALYPYFPWIQGLPSDDLPDLPLEAEGDALVASWLLVMAGLSLSFAAEQLGLRPEDLEGRDYDELWELVHESGSGLESFEVHETDVFQVLDWYRLEEALAGEERVEGCIRNGWLVHASKTSEDVAAILDVHWEKGKAKNLIRLLKPRSEDPAALRDWLSKTAGTTVRWLWRADGIAQ